jgi:hypothetical protein
LKLSKTRKLTTTILLALFTMQFVLPFITPAGNEGSNTFIADIMNEDNENTTSDDLPKDAQVFTPDEDGYIRNWLTVGTFLCNDTWTNFTTKTGNHVNASLNYTAGDYATPEDTPINGSNNAKLW